MWHVSVQMIILTDQMETDLNNSFMEITEGRVREEKRAKGGMRIISYSYSCVVDVHGT